MLNASAMGRTRAAAEAGGVVPDVVQVRTLLETLVRERQRLRAIGADAGELEANRLAICYWQARLSQLAVASWRVTSQDVV